MSFKSLEEVWDEERAKPWFDPLNDEWMNRFSEEKEFDLYNTFKIAGRLEDYRNGETSLVAGNVNYPQTPLLDDQWVFSTDSIKY
mgnify:CR=1 FL=1